MTTWFQGQHHNHPPSLPTSHHGEGHPQQGQGADPQLTAKSREGTHLLLHMRRSGEVGHLVNGGKDSAPTSRGKPTLIQVPKELRAGTL